MMGIQKLGVYIELDHENSDAYLLYSHDLYHHYMYQGTSELIRLYWVMGSVVI